MCRKCWGSVRNLEMVGFKANQIATCPHTALPRKIALADPDRQSAGANCPPRSAAVPVCKSSCWLATGCSDLPDELAACTNLELLRIAANHFKHLPDWLFKLPRLAWLAYAGNPCSDAGEIAAMAKNTIRHIDWYTLELQEKLGEGASGVIHRANMRSADDSSQVAVKIFKGALTSDGLPRSEKAACIAAGAHPGLIPVAGKISGHPEGRPGMVMSLIDTSFRNLAGPPSLESCTRDVYSEEVLFSLETALEHRARYRDRGRASACPGRDARRPVRAQHPVESNRANVCWAISARPPSFRSRMRDSPQACNASKCAPLPVCWKS